MTRMQRLCIGLACAGTVLGFLLPAPPATATRAPSADWEIPALETLRRDGRQALAAAKRGLRWSGGRETGGGRATSPAWQLAAITASPEPRALFRTEKGKELLRLAPGDSLPDGRRIEGIERDRVILSDGACRHVLQLFRAEQVEVGSDCPSSDASSN